ncbi:alpha-1,2-fucosyltransferase [Saccharicrinis sp. 156]|uniref:alpha-1,2-fucosyltransferase n=1 Tax=Saccharicrinis sp. 156 TaxID=3417574 RepID=UPI003D358230
MIVIKLRGGLANQMFQYAIGRRISYQYKVPLLIDVCHYEDEQTEEKTIREFGLNWFNIDVTIASAAQISNSKGWYSNTIKRKANTLFNKMLPYYKQNIVKEKQTSFDKNILKVRKNCYLEGFWQSAQYFKDIEEIIRKDFQFKIPPSSGNIEYLNQIGNCNSVSVHIRRGDYVTSKHYNNVHQVLSPEYYQKAATIIEEQITNPTYFVFSDDPQWAKENLIFKHKAVFIDHNNGKNAFEDLRLMSNCKHHIIANSTFSWWGAWLNPNKDKIVIAPDKWYKMEKLENKDILPEKWIRL